MIEPHQLTQALLAAMMHSTEPMVLTDPLAPDHPMIAVNAAFEALTGYGQAETVNRNCRFLQGVDTDPETPRRIRRCIAERIGCVEWVLNYRRDGTKFWNLLFISPIFAADGTLLHFFGNQRDITQGPPPGLADYALGKSVMKLNGQEEFDALLLGLAEAPNDAAGARTLEQMVAAARRLNEVTTQLEPAPWAPPPGG